MRDKCVEMSDNANKMRDRLAELIADARNDYYDFSDEMHENGMPVGESSEEYIADILLANGVVVPPYSIGSKVYSVINSMTLPIPIDVYECEIQRYVLTQHGISAIVRFKKGSVTYGDIHKDVSELHLTPEEAERALKGAVSEE